MGQSITGLLRVCNNHISPFPTALGGGSFMDGSPLLVLCLAVFTCLFKNFMSLLSPDHMSPVSGLHLSYWKWSSTSQGHRHHTGVLSPAEVCEESAILDVNPQESGPAWHYKRIFCLYFCSLNRLMWNFRRIEPTVKVMPEGLSSALMNPLESQGENWGGRAGVPWPSALSQALKNLFTISCWLGVLTSHRDVPRMALRLSALLKRLPPFKKTAFSIMKCRKHSARTATGFRLTPRIFVVYTLTSAHYQSWAATQMFPSPSQTHMRAYTHTFTAHRLCTLQWGPVMLGKKAVFELKNVYSNPESTNRNWLITHSDIFSVGLSWDFVQG